MKLRPNFHPEEMYVDNCCAMKKFIQQLWGDIKVYLDAFHAQQRFPHIMTGVGHIIWGSIQYGQVQYSQTWCGVVLCLMPCVGTVPFGSDNK